MSHINLLPWREQQREKQKQLYLVLLASLAIVTVLGVMGVGRILDGMIADQNARNQFLEKEIAILDVRIGEISRIRDQRDNIEKRISLIRQLQEHRNVAPKVMDELARLVPPGVAFSTLDRRDDRIEITGISESNNRLADFMRRLEQSSVFIDSEISSIVADTSTTEGVSDFKLTFLISPDVAPPLLTLDEEQAQ